MGADQSCKMDKFSNACEIHNCVEGVIGLKSESASPSDQWILTLKKNATYDNKQIKQAFLKYWSEIDIDDKISTAIHGLNYEMWTYKHIIYKLLKQNICPNFVLYLASGKFCTESQLQKITDASNIPQVNLLRNMMFLVKHYEQRPAIHVSTNFQSTVRTFGAIRFHMLITEHVDGMSLHTYCGDKSLDLNIMQEIMFQIAVGCYAMNLSKMVHNDMHSKNVLLPLNTTPLSYCVEGTVYNLTPKYLVKIFDFDHAYVERYKRNEITRRNELYNGLDMFYVIAYICHVYKKNVQLTEYLINLVVKDPTEDVKERVFNYYNNGRHDMTADWCNKHIKPTLEIIKSAGEPFIKHGGNREECMYHCSADMFDESGRISTLTNLNTRNKTALEELHKVRDENTNLKNASVIGGALSLATIAAIGTRSRK